MPAALNACMQASWFKEELTLYARMVLTFSCWRKGKSRWQAVPLLNGSMKDVGSPNGLFGSETLAPATDSVIVQYAQQCIQRT
jgi:hypothetical protein